MWRACLVGWRCGGINGRGGERKGRNSAVVTIVVVVVVVVVVVTVE